MISTTTRLRALFFACTLHIPMVTATSKHEIEIFGKWHAWQQVYEDKNIANLTHNLDDNFVKTFKEKYEKNISILKNLSPLLTALSNGSIQEDGFQLQASIDEQMSINFNFLYYQLEHNVPAFIDCLISNGIATKNNAAIEEQSHYDHTIEKYKAFGRLLFAQDDSFKENEYLLAFATRLFEYAYEERTFQHYQNLLTTHDYYPVARFINASVWYSLVGEGWKHWHANTLDTVKKHAAQGHEIVYPAGGTDIYQFLREGVYNITIIDPFLPTQARYYSEGWEFLLTGEAGSTGINDEIRFGPECNSIKMKRVDFQTSEPFYSKLSNNQILTTKKSTTTWHVFDRNNKQIGHVIIHRRPVTQADFQKKALELLVMSYDEMTYLAVPDVLNGWGIDPTLFAQDLKIYVKQLRKPVSKEEMLNIRIASMLNYSDLRFINIASDPT